MKRAGWFMAGTLLGGTFFFFAAAYAGAPSLQGDLFGREATVLFVGDMFFDRQIRQMAEAHGEDFLFSCTDPLFALADFVVGNLEGPITDAPSVSAGSVVGSAENFVFTFPPSTAALLARHNVGVLNLGNNHIANFGQEGIASTRSYLSSAGLAYFGGTKGDEPVYYTTEHGVKLSFVSYNEFGGSSPQDVAKTIAAERAEGRVVVVFAHWGDEYVDSSARLRPIATLFAQSGAALVVGAHPHSIGIHEVLGGVPVYYSLGNFIFDQYWSDAVHTGLALEVKFSKNGAASIEEHLVVLNRDGSTCPLMKF